MSSVTHQASLSTHSAIWSARDGVIAAEAARGLAHERDDEVEIRCGHFAMSSAPDALEAVLRVLAQTRKATFLGVK